jgi:hypothetical protein
MMIEGEESEIDENQNLEDGEQDGQEDDELDEQQ